VASIFKPPVRLVKYPIGPLFGRAPHPVGVTVLREAGLYRRVIDPREEELRAADRIFLGGRVHVVDDVEAAALTAAGYEDYLSPADIVPPDISSLSARAESQWCAFQAGTEAGATVTVLYGVTPALGSTGSLAGFGGTYYGGTVQGLIPSTTYYYRIQAVDAAGNTTVFPDSEQPPLTVRTISYADDDLDVFTDGFESGTLAAWPTVTGAASASGAAAYAGSYGVLLAPSASAGSVATSTTKWPQTRPWGVAAFRFRFGALPTSGSADIATLRNTGGSGHADLFVHSGGNFWLDLVGGSSEIDTGIPADTGEWHTAQIKTWYGDSTHKAWLLLDGVEYAITQPGAASGFVRSFHLGTTGTKTYSLDVDDVTVLVGFSDPGWCAQ
jgi:hypothetical protein